MKTLKPLLLPLILAVVGLALYNARIRHQMVDFGVYRTAAERVATASPLYRPDDGHYQFKYLPAFAMAMLPFGWASLEGAKAVWFAISFGLMLVLVRWSVRALPERRWSDRTLVIIVAIAMLKFFGHELTLGQTNLLLAVMIVGALLALEVDAPIAASVLLGLAVFVKPYAVIFVPWLAATRGIRPALVVAGIVAAGLVLPAVLYGWSGNLELLAAWFHTVTDSTAPNLLNPDNVSVAGMWAKWLGTGTLATILAATTGLALIGLVVAAWHRRQSVESPDYLEIALLMMLIPLLSPQGWDYVLLLATPGVICLADRWRELDAPWRAASATALVLMCLTVFDLMGRAAYGRFMALSLVSVAAIVVAVSLVHLRWRRLA